MWVVLSISRTSPLLSIKCVLSVLLTLDKIRRNLRQPLRLTVALRSELQQLTTRRAPVLSRG